MKEFWSSRIRALEPYTPGEQPRDRKWIKLNTNENPYPPSPRALEAVRAAAEAGLRLYPDPEASALREALAEFHGRKPEEVFVGNGSDEILAFCFQAFFGPEQPVVFPDITYSFYPVYAGLFGVPFRQIPLNEDFTLPVERFLGDNGGVVFPNPNAPTGIALPLAEVERIASGNPRAVVVIDEAYVDFGAESAAACLEALGFEICPSCANFLFVRHPDYGGKALYEGLRERGILVRRWDQRRIQDHLRITVGSEADMDALMDALSALTARR